MIVWGGGQQLTYLNGGGIYDPDSDTWISTSTGENLPTGRHYPNSIWTGSNFIIWGGNNSDGPLNSGAQLDPLGNSWASISSVNAPSARYLGSAIWTGEEMIVWGGGINANATLGTNTGGRYNPATDTWTATGSGGNVPASRVLHKAIWTGSTMIIWGGANTTSPNSGGVYGP
jgi:hypothetical protein